MTHFTSSCVLVGSTLKASVHKDVKQGKAANLPKHVWCLLHRWVKLVVPKQLFPIIEQEATHQVCAETPLTSLGLGRVVWSDESTFQLQISGCGRDAENMDLNICSDGFRIKIQWVCQPMVEESRCWQDEWLETGFNPLCCRNQSRRFSFCSAKSSLVWRVFFLYISLSLMCCINCSRSSYTSYFTISQNETPVPTYNVCFNVVSCSFSPCVCAGQAEAELQEFSPCYRKQFSVARFSQVQDELEQHKAKLTQLLKQRVRVWLFEPVPHDNLHDNQNLNFTNETTWSKSCQIK